MKRDVGGRSAGAPRVLETVPEQFAQADDDWGMTHDESLFVVLAQSEAADHLSVVPLTEVSPDLQVEVFLDRPNRAAHQSSVGDARVITPSDHYTITRILHRDQTKEAFDKLSSQKDQFESVLGPIEWERLNNRRASRLALYHEGHIGDEKGHPELRKWAVETMIKFYTTLLEPAEQAILEAKNG